MKKRIIAAVLLAICSAFILIRYSINAVFVNGYHEGRYLDSTESRLLNVNFPQAWLPYYNLGNSAYQQGDYNKAILLYEEALEQDPRHPAACSIRVNLALAMLQKIDFEHDDSESIVNQLLAARAVLTEDGCAGETEPDGHSAEAEELKKNIDDMLQQMGGEGESGEDEESGESEEQEESEEGQSEQQDTSEREQQIQQQLEEMMQDNMEERQDVQEWYSQEGSYNQYNGKTW
ncbi:MAG: tetratricopeptide repeat protein [Solobacterium sp.]|nr:tetratricopeptide repeat protein [Solobacterium sp.]